MTNKTIVFLLGNCIYLKAFIFIPLYQTITLTKIILVKTQQNIIYRKILEKSSQKSVNNFFKLMDKVCKLQKERINKINCKFIISNISSKTAIISSSIT